MNVRSFPGLPLFLHLLSKRPKGTLVLKSSLQGVENSGRARYSRKGIWIWLGEVCQEDNAATSYSLYAVPAQVCSYVIINPENINNIYLSPSTTKLHPWVKAVTWDKRDSLVICNRCFWIHFFHKWWEVIQTFICDCDAFVKQMWSTSGTQHLYTIEIISGKKWGAFVHVFFI